MTIDETLFAKRLREARKRANLTQPELAARINLSSQSISGYENGKLPTLENAYILASELHVSIDELCGLPEHRAAEIKTEREAIETLYKLQRYLDASLTTSGLLFEQAEHGNALENHPDILEFINDFDTMNKLLANGTINQGTFNTWYNGALNKASSTDYFNAGWDEEWERMDYEKESVNQDGKRQ